MALNPRLQGLDPASVQAVIATAQALEAGRADQAAATLVNVVARYPGHPEVQRLQAGILNLQGQNVQAINVMQHALAQRPTDALYHNTMATVLAAAGELDAALQALRRACELQPDLVSAWFNRGLFLARGVRYEAAAEAFRHVLALQPGHLSARTELADMLHFAGRIDEAVAEYRCVLSEQPLAGMAWWGLADIKTLQLQASDVDSMRFALQDARMGDDDRIATGFALAKALDDLGCYAESLETLVQANAVARRRRVWNRTAFSRAVAGIDAKFTPPPIVEGLELGCEVIFIVGMPRSGTTLVEQILASHSRVAGAGELPDVSQALGEESASRKQPYPQWVPDARAADWARIGRSYLKRTQFWRREREIHTDKMPNNWVQIPAIRAMLPAARIIVCRRDPLETCLSCYRQMLSGNDYTRTFEDLGAYWQDFDRYTRRWARRYPEHVFFHDYEALLADPEARIRALLEFCGLEFEPACLNFHETQRDVRSPSAMQVRQGLRRDTARAHRYGNLLDPLRSALGLPAFGDERAD